MDCAIRFLENIVLFFWKVCVVDQISKTTRSNGSNIRFTVGVGVYPPPLVEADSWWV